MGLLQQRRVFQQLLMSAENLRLGTADRRGLQGLQCLGRFAQATFQRRTLDRFTGTGFSDIQIRLGHLNHLAERRTRRSTHTAQQACR